MKLYKSDLKATQFWDNLPEKFKQLNEGDEFFAFFYLYADDSSQIVGIDDNSQKVIPRILVSVYRNAPQGYRLGYFQYPLDSQNTLFYQFLKYYNGSSVEVNDLNQYFKSLKIEDLKVVEDKYVNTLNNNVFKIYSRDNFSNALDRFLRCSNEVKTNTFTILDSIDNYCKVKIGKSMYGEVVRKIVMAIRSPNGGLVPDTNSKLRYLYVGENSELIKDQNSELYKNLEEARDMFRNKFTSNEIFLKTKWFYNKYDRKWRMPISDTEFEIKSINLEDIYIRYGSNFADQKDNIKSAVFNEDDSKISNYVYQNYDTYLGDIVSHPTLFKHYPELYNLPVFYALTNSNKYSFYYSPSPRYLMIFGNPNNMAIREVFIHEIQHAIQRIENYGTGGNEYIAKLVSTIGGEDLKEYLFLKETAFRLFKKEVESNYEKWYNEYTVNLASSKHFEQININNVEGFKREFKRIYETISALYIQLVNSSIINPIILYVPKNILDIFDKLKQVHEKTKTAVGRLSSQGYSNQEINRILFNAYESLSGEIEARNVQQISKLDAEMQDYFVPLSSESIQDEKVGVIYDEMVSDEIFPTKIVGAIEKTKEDLYIIHLNWANTPKPILHEIGHLLHDLLNTDTLTDYVGNKIKNELPNLDYENNSNLIGEIFCDLFLGYLERLNLSEEFTYEISVEIKYKDIRIFDQDFDNVFLAKEDSKSDNEMMKMLQFLKKLNESIQ
jgi:hypothetical protein